MAVDYLSALNSSGSGLNITQIVDSLVDAETNPERVDVDSQIEKKTLEISSLGEVASNLSTLKTSASALTNKTKLTSTSASIKNTISVTSPSKAKVFSSDVTVTTLATPQTLEFSGFTSANANTGSGNITVDFGNWITNGTATDTDSLFSASTSVSASTSLGNPTSHSTLGGLITIATSAGGDQSSTSFTVVGKDMAGNAITEVITGAGDGATSTGTKVFKSVTSITPGSTVGSGTVTVGHSASSFGVNSALSSSTVTVGSGTGTLTSVAASLNGISGVSASILNKGEGIFSLVVRTETGVNNAIKITVSENSGDTGLSMFDTNSDNSTHQTTAATDASLNVDGVTIKRGSNTIDDLFDGFTMVLTETTSSSFRVSSSLDKDEALINLQSFIDAVNKARTSLNNLTKQGSETVEAGPLYNNVIVNSIKEKLITLTTGEIKGFGNDSLYLSELGVRTERDGTLSIDESIFNSQLSLNSTVFDSIFNTMFSSSSPYLNVTASASTSDPEPGAYGFVYDGTTAKLNGLEMTVGSDADGNTYYLSKATSDLGGIKLQPTQTVNSAYVYYGRSLIDTLSTYIDSALSATGVIAKSEQNISTKLSDLKLDLSEVDEKVETLTKRYLGQFSAMESAVTSLNSTGDYLKNMMDAWTKES